MQVLPDFRHTPVIFQVDLLLFQRGPQPLDEDVVEDPPATVHADENSVVLEQAGEIVAGELRSLVGVEYHRTDAVRERLVERFENTRPDPWVNRLNPKQMDSLVSAIVAFEMPLERVEGKFKLGQNRSPEDQRASLAGLATEATDAEQALVTLTQSYQERALR